MKRLIFIFALCLGFLVSCYDDSALLERIDALEKNAIASINEQINAIKASITSLEAVDKELKATIQALEARDASLQGDIDKLKETDASLETKIGELKTYVNTEILSTEEWATATFATIEKYNEIVNDLTLLKELVESNYTTLDRKIDDSVESIKAWVNDVLKGYYTTIEVDELLKTLKDSLDGLQAKLDNLLRDFIITFDDSEIGILAGGTTSVGYTITGATEKTTVKAFGQNGWNAKVTPNGTDKGEITVTAPNAMTDDEIIVLVYDGEYRTIMSSINFVTGVVTPSQTAVELEAEAGTIDISVTSNLNYKVSIPEDAKDWLSVVDTRATKTETITFAYTEWVGGIRKSIVSFIDDANNIVSTMTFIQQGSAAEVTLTEAGTLLQAIGEGIYKDVKGLIVNGPINGTDIICLNQMSQLTYLNLLNARIVEGGKAYNKNYYTENDVIGNYMFEGFGNTKIPCYIILPKNIQRIGQFSFNHSKIGKIDCPNTIKTIDTHAFSYCFNLKLINLSENLEEIGGGAFFSTPLAQVDFPNNLKIIGESAFFNCPLESINLPVNLEKIGSCAFENCEKLREITIPQNTAFLGKGAFGNCHLVEIHVKANPQTLIEIEKDVFSRSSSFYSNIYDTATLYIPKGTKDAYLLTDFGRFKNIVEE